MTHNNRASSKKTIDFEMSSHAGPPIWLISFTDVIALMLTFFVLLYAMSDPNEERWDRKIGLTVNAEAEFSGASRFAGNDEGVNVSRIDYRLAENLDYLEALFQEIRRSNEVGFFFTARRTENHIDLIFDKIKDEKDFSLFFNYLISVLNELDNQIAVATTNLDLNEIQFLQSVIKRMREQKYNKPVDIRAGGADLKTDYRFVISVLPHDGRRINR